MERHSPKTNTRFVRLEPNKLVNERKRLSDRRRSGNKINLVGEIVSGACGRGEGKIATLVPDESSPVAPDAASAQVSRGDGG